MSSARRTICGPEVLPRLQGQGPVRRDDGEAGGGAQERRPVRRVVRGGPRGEWKFMSLRCSMIFCADFSMKTHYFDEFSMKFMFFLFFHAFKDKAQCDAMTEKLVEAHKNGGPYDEWCAEVRLGNCRPGFRVGGVASR